MIEKIKLEDLKKENILAFGEIYQGKLHPSSLEILTPLKEIAEKLDKSLILVCLADSLESIHDLESLKKSLADEVWFIFHSKLRDFKDDLYARVFIEIIKSTNPYGVFFPATLIGVSIAPRIAGVLNLGLCAHVNALEIENNQIIMARPTYGENIIAKLTSKTIPVMATISIGAFSPKTSEKTPVFKEVIFPENFSWESALKVRSFRSSKKKPSRLSTAKVVVAGGRGLKNKENFQKLFELAEILKAEVGATRPVCYEGWVEEERMIGVSGVTVKPKVYIGFGISGALQHTAGMENSEFIIAINTDKEAPLVKMAHLSLIGDAKKILDLLLKKLKR
ncbi:electron transfer flavoprotein subunit alpha/FixB family protein [Thermodesulfobacterium hydrogeniphilum]|uniref:electron transfer flavoprotein subunit alpha/FixB family protein n=1 Tax=Thermodesulfobacterium hydrogeniphilum TaxID=161156 RepID=UPI00056EF7D7|nr:electron transfer flavoprotein subunit alpha/FixB family protein [Thermodesulfobacterium hydrogeniphilum]